jgi:hypothetical protein
VTTSLAADFFVILVVLTAFSFVLRHGPRSFLPALVAQSALLAAQLRASAPGSSPMSSG